MNAHPPHPHGPVDRDGTDWGALVGQAEEEGELLLAFVTDTASWLAERRGPDALPVGRVLDIGSGPGVGTCELARRFPAADVIAVDASPAMLDRAARRAAERGLDGRITTLLAELPDGLCGLDPCDVIWASMSLHHTGDEIGALALLRGLLAPSGLLAVAEMAEPMQVVPDDVDVGRPGLADRLARAEADWFAAMRAALPASVRSADLPSMLGAGGFGVAGSRRAPGRFAPPLSGAAPPAPRGPVAAPPPRCRTPPARSRPASSATARTGSTSSSTRTICARSRCWPTPTIRAVSSAVPTPSSPRRARSSSHGRGHDPE